jgi:cystathionine beta-lyase
MPMIVEDLSEDFLRRRRSSKWTTHGTPVLPSNPAEMDFSTAPAIQARMEDLVAGQRYGYAGKGPTGLVCAVADAFAARMRGQFGWAADPAAVRVLGDLVQGTAASLVAYSEPGDGVLLQLPAYPAFLRVIAETGRVLIGNEMRDTGSGFALDMAGFAAALRPNGMSGGVRVVLLCHPQNPTGRVFEAADFAGLPDLVRRHDLVVVSDEIHADLVYAPHRHVPLALMFPDMADRIVTLYSATKSFNIPGLRCGVMHFGSPALRERFEARIPPSVLGTPGTPGMEATIAAWEDGQNWCDALVATLESNRDHLLARVAAEMPGMRMYRPQATYLAWLDCSRLGLPAAPYEFFLERASVGAGDGRNFGTPGEQFIRLNFATSRAILDEKIDRMVRAVRGLNAPPDLVS